MPGALEGIRVVDWSTSVSGAWCSRLLADYGAEVVAVEPPEGHPARRMPPLGEDGTGLLGACVLANKRSIVADLRSEKGRERALLLARSADILVSNLRPSELRQLALGYGDIARPALIMVHITPHGLTGELAEAPGNDLTVAARSGWADINGLLDREPLKPSGWQASFCAGAAAYIAAVGALHHRNGHPGEGQEVDVAELDAMLSTFAPAVLRSMYDGKLWTRRRETDMTAGPVPVADGHFALTISRAHFWRDAMNLLGLHDLAEDERWESSHYRAAHKHEYTSRVEAAMREWNKQDLFDELAARRVVAGPVLSMEELASNEHLEARGFWAETGDGRRYPGPPWRMSATPWSLRSRSPAAGAHSEVEA